MIDRPEPERPVRVVIRCRHEALCGFVVYGSDQTLLVSCFHY